MMIRPTTAADIEEFAGGQLSDTIRAYSIEHEGEVLAMAGIRHSPTKTCFGDIKPEIKKSPRMLVRLARKVTGLMELYDEPVYAIADEDEPTAVNFLLHAGFEYLGKNEQGEVFIWPR